MRNGRDLMAGARSIAASASERGADARRRKNGTEGANA
jgi:hypothetical protein